jgi:tetratricopeptide (TPR) repeat protein
MLAIGKGDAAEADSLLRKAISLKPDYAAALYNLGTVRWDLRDPSGAEEAYGRAIRSDSSLVEAYNNLGALLLSLARAKEASSILDIGLAKDRERPGANELRGFLLKNRGKAGSLLGSSDEALTYWTQASEIIPGNAELLRLLAISLESHGRRDEALERWRTIARIGSQNEREEASEHINRLSRAD